MRGVWVVEGGGKEFLASCSWSLAWPLCFFLGGVGLASLLARSAGSCGAGVGRLRGLLRRAPSLHGGSRWMGGGGEGTSIVLVAVEVDAILFHEAFEAFGAGERRSQRLVDGCVSKWKRQHGTYAAPLDTTPHSVATSSKLIC